eukprot:COSAG02_NODE_2043_length_10026_cov_10.550217_3_plen_374_part_00
MEGAHLWPQLQALLNPAEVEEARRIIGPSLLESISDAENECKALEEILDLFREQVNEDLAKLDAKPALPAPPVLEYVEREIQFFVTQLRDRAVQHGLEPDAMLRPQTPKEESVLRYVSRPGTAGSSRPSTPGSGPMSRPSTAGSRPSSRSSGSRPGSARNLSSIINPSKVSVAAVQDKGTLEQLRAALTEERDALIQYAEDIRTWLDYEHDEAHEKTKQVDTRPPALSDMREYSGRLQSEFLTPDPLAALVSQPSGSATAGGAMGAGAPKASTTLQPVRAPGGAMGPPAAAESPLGRVGRTTPAAGLAGTGLGGCAIAEDTEGFAQAAAASSRRMGRAAKLRTEVATARVDGGTTPAATATTAARSAAGIEAT